MAAGQKPDFSLSIKAVSAGREERPHQVAAYWREPDGRLNGGLDKKIKQLKIEYEDGTVVHVTRPNGKTTHWLNLREWSAQPKKAAESWGGKAEDDEIPF